MTASREPAGAPARHHAPAAGASSRTVPAASQGAGKVLHEAIATTGIEGLDEVLGGGFTANRLYLVEGVPGSGKTTLAMQFLMEGVRRGEPVLYVTLSETREELLSVSNSHG